MLKPVAVYIFIFFLLLAGLPALAQVPIRGMPRLGGGGMRSGGGSDSLQFEKRDFSDDSVTVIFRYLDSARFNSLDSSINDFYRKIPLKPEHIPGKYWQCLPAGIVFSNYEARLGSWLPCL